MTYVVLAPVKYCDRFTYVAVEWGRLHNAFLPQINMKTADTTISRLTNARGFFTNIRRWQVTYCRRQFTWALHSCHCYALAGLRVQTKNIASSAGRSVINDGQYSFALSIQPHRQPVERVISSQVERSASMEATPSATVEVRNACGYNFTSSCTFTKWCLSK